MSDLVWASTGLHAVYVAESLKPHSTHMLPTLANAHWAWLSPMSATSAKQAKWNADCEQHANDIESEPMPTAAQLTMDS